MAINKVIHYCWFGKSKLPNLAQKCIDSWKKYCPDYEIIEWNEENFDVNCNLYTKQAYEAKKYAFVSDYVRLYALYNYGGVYMDTDVEVLKGIDCFLVNKAFSGFETIDTVPTGIMGCEKQHPFFKTLLSHYNEISFLKDDGSYNLTTNVETITKYCSIAGIKLNNKLQTVQDFKLYPKDYFCPKDHKTGRIYITKNSYTIHHFSGSWIPKTKKIKRTIINILGENITNKLVTHKKKIKLFLKINKTFR